MSLAVLPTDTRLNPLSPDDNEYHVPTDVVYLMRRTDTPRTMRAVQSAGDLGDAFAIGTAHELRHDQTGRRLGTFRIIAIDGEGEPVAVPVKHAVVK